jgi:hypothetical protein
LAICSNRFGVKISGSGGAIMTMNRTADLFRSTATRKVMRPMLDVTNSSLCTEAVDLLACEVLADLYRAYCGARPLAVRSYRDEEALLLLLRFEPDSLEDDDTGAGSLVGTALRAMPGMVASAVEARTGERLAPGNLSLCSVRGLAVFAFTALEDDDEQSGGEDPFRTDSIFAARAQDVALRLAG